MCVCVLCVRERKYVCVCMFVCMCVKEKMCVCVSIQVCVLCVCVYLFCSLNVCYNRAGDRGLCQLARCLLEHNSTLTHLYIWGNTIGTPTCNVCVCVCVCLESIWCLEIA